MSMREIMGSDDLEEGGAADQAPEAAAVNSDRQQPQPQGNDTSSSR